MRRFLGQYTSCIVVPRQATHTIALRMCVHNDNTEAPTRSPPPVPKAATTSGMPGSGAGRPPPRHPMELLSAVFHSHPSALRLHRELTIALADGDSERAADLASVLASTVRRVVDSSDQAQTNTEAEPTATKEDTLPAPAADDVLEAIDKTRESLESAQWQGGPSTRTATSQPTQGGGTTKAPFWRDPDHLCVTLLESTFETDVPYENSSPLSEEGLRAEEHERQEMAILDTYLEREAVRWKSQKEAVLHAVLQVAQQLRLTPEEIHVYESSSSREPLFRGTDTEDHDHHLNVLKHANLLIRGEVPDLAFADKTSRGSDASSPTPLQMAQSELTVLKKRMAEQGTPLSASEEEMALYELTMARSTMRYLVGLHKDLEAAVNASAGVREAWEATDATTRDRCPTPAALFVSRVMERLHPVLPLRETLDGVPPATSNNPSDSATDADGEEQHAIAVPVLPFTFMLKACLWFTPAPPEAGR